MLKLFNKCAEHPPSGWGSGAELKGLILGENRLLLKANRGHADLCWNWLRNCASIIICNRSGLLRPTNNFLTFLWVLHNLSRVFNGQESYFTILKKKKNSGLAPLNSVSQRYVTLRRSKVLTLNFGFFQKSVIFLNNAQKYCYKPSL